MRLVTAIGNENFFKHSGNGTRRYKDGIKSTGLKAGAAWLPGSLISISANDE
jgi:hypothetical protein